MTSSLAPPKDFHSVSELGILYVSELGIFICDPCARAFAAQSYVGISPNFVIPIELYTQT